MLDPRRKQKWAIVRDVGEIRGARNEGSWVELVPYHKAGTRQIRMALIGIGRIGLSNVSK